MANSDSSIQRRLMLTTLPLLAVFLLLAGWGLDRAYQRDAIDAEFQKLQLQAWSLMGDADIEQQQLVMPEQLQEPQFSAPESELFGFVIDAARNQQWQSASVELSDHDLTSIVARLSAVRSGESRRQRLESGAFMLQQGVTYVNDTQQKHTLTFIVVSLGSLYMQQLAEFRQSLYLWLGLVLSTLLVAQFFALRWGLRPMQLLAEELSDLEQGKRGALQQNYPKELQTVTRNLNQLLASKNAQQSRYRNTLADLAHSLKTPLAVLQSHLDAMDVEGKDKLVDQVAIMDSIVSRQLKRAIIQRQTTAQQTESNDEALSIVGSSLTSVSTVLRRLCSALETVYSDREIALTFAVEEAFCAIDEADLMEMLGGILDNAFKYGRSQVSVSTQQKPGEIVIVIEDDGSGIPERQGESVLQRGVRLDTAKAGQGIGLAVTQDLVDAYGGELDITASNLGGARIAVTLALVTAPT